MFAARDLTFMALSAFWEEALSAFLADILGAVISVEVVRWDVTVENGLLTAVSEVSWEPVSLALVASFLSWAAGAVVETESGSVAWSTSSKVFVPEIAVLAFRALVEEFSFWSFLDPELTGLFFKFDLAAK